MNITRRSFVTGAAAGLLGTANVAHAAGRLRPGCQANAWNLDPDRFDLLLTAVREMKELGFQGYETNIRFVQPQLSRAKEARAQLEAFGLEFVGAHTSLPDYQKLETEKFGDTVGKLAGQARQFGAKALVVSHKGLSATGEFSAEALDKKTRALNLAGKRCADAGLTLAYHNHQPEFRNHAAEEKGLLEHTDPKLVYLMLDIGHAWVANPEAIAVFEANPNRAFGLHVRDFHNKVSVPLGQGEFPLKKLAEVIRKSNWTGWLIDEEERPEMKDKPGKLATGPSRKAMKEIFGV